MKNTKKKNSLKLTFIERIMLASVLPESGNMLNMVLGRSLVIKVAPTPQEVKTSGMKQASDGKMEVEDTTVIKEKSFTFEDAEVDFLKAQVTSLDGTNKVTFQNLTLCEKIKGL